MKKRRVFKKGRYIITRKGSIVINLSKKLYKSLKPFSEKIKIVGSIRRKNPEPVDVDIVLIPKDKQKIINYLNTQGKYLRGGEKMITFKIQGIRAEIYYADSKNWGAMLMAYTGLFGSNIGLRTLAKRKGFLLNQYGLFSCNGEYIAGKTEKSIYKALGKKYKVPRLR